MHSDTVPSTAPATTQAGARLRRAETDVLCGVQSTLGAVPVVRGARALSLAGEHALGWLVLGAVGAAVDSPRRGSWLTALGAVAAAHGGAVAIKRVLRRPRPHDPRVRVHVGTPSALSMPSAHAMSTASAAVVYGRLLGRPLGAAVLPAMLLSRLVLGVHFPSDVLTGAALGTAIGRLANRRMGGRQ